MDRRLLHLHDSRQPPQLLHWKRIVHHHSLRHVSCVSCLVIDDTKRLDRPLYLLGYVPAHNRVYLVDKDVNVYSYALSLSMVEYQTAVLREDMEAAAEILPSIPKEHRNKIAAFLEGRGLKELALEVTTDPDQKFELSLQLDDLDAAVEIARTVPELEAETKWKAIGDRALAVWRFDLARESFEKAGDLSALMLLLLATGDRDGLGKLAVQAGACRHVVIIRSIASEACWAPCPHRGQGPEQPGVRHPVTAGRPQIVR